jgi:hypothetical protein
MGDKQLEDDPLRARERKEGKARPVLLRDERKRGEGAKLKVNMESDAPDSPTSEVEMKNVISIRSLAKGARKRGREVRSLRTTPLEVVHATRRHMRVVDELEKELKNMIGHPPRELSIVLARDGHARIRKAPFLERSAIMRWKGGLDLGRVEDSLVDGSRSTSADGALLNSQSETSHGGPHDVVADTHTWTKAPAFVDVVRDIDGTRSQSRGKERYPPVEGVQKGNRKAQVPAGAGQLKEGHRIGGNGEPIETCGNTFEIVLREGVVWKGKGEEGSEEGVNGVYFGGEREPRRKGGVRVETIAKLLGGVPKGVTIHDTWAHQKP